MKMKAIADRIFIRLSTKEETAGGLLLAADIEEPRTVGVVESVGEKVNSVQIGDKVLFHVFDEVETPEKDLVVVRENSILGVISDE